MSFNVEVALEQVDGLRNSFGRVEVQLQVGSDTQTSPWRQINYGTVVLDTLLVFKGLAGSCRVRLDCHITRVDVFWKPSLGSASFEVSVPSDADAASECGRQVLYLTRSGDAGSETEGRDGNAREAGRLQLRWRVVRSQPYDELAEVQVATLPRAAQLYAHGGFVGAPVSLYGDATWNRVLSGLDPDVVETAETLLQTQSRRKDPRLALLPLLENNPVLCAYGTVRSGGAKQRVKAPSCTPVPPPQDTRAAAGLLGVVALDSAAVLDQPCSSLKVLHRKLANPAGRAFGHRWTTGMDMEADVASESGCETGVGEGRHREDAVAASERAGSSCLHSGLCSSQLLSASSLEAAGKPGGAAVAAWQEGEGAVNAFGYAATALEWDIWLDPAVPGQLAKATVDHGAVSDLVMQALLVSLGCSGAARRAGRRYIRGHGISPIDWLQAFGAAVNLACGDAAADGLALARPPQRFARLRVTLDSAAALPAMDSNGLCDAYADIHVAASRWSLGRRRSSVKQRTLNPEWGEEFEFYPLELDAGGEGADAYAALVVDLVDQDPLSRNDRIGRVEVPLASLLDVPGSGGAPGGGPGSCSHTVTLAVQLHKDAVQRTRSSRRAADVDLEAAPQHSTLTLTLHLEQTDTLQALCAAGVAPGPAQTCLALLSHPGGVFLDIKSRYSSPADLDQLVAALAGVGVHAKAVCSFTRSQVEPVRSCPFILFFHGLGTLEAACDNGQVKEGDRVLFNGASFLVDADSASSLPWETRADDHPIDPRALSRFIGLVLLYRVIPGIYIQEADASAASVDALMRLVGGHPELFPLGFSYGHIRDRALYISNQGGRGFASQQLVDEMAAKKEMGEAARLAVGKGLHSGASALVVECYLQRLLEAHPVLRLAEQKLLLAVLAEIWPLSALQQALRAMGGVIHVLYRFWEHFEVVSPVTILEQGFVLNLTKPLCRLLRERGVLAALPAAEKAELARLITSPIFHSFGVARITYKLGLRKSLHRLMAEALLCLLESCTATEFEALATQCGGRDGLDRYLRSRLPLHQRLRRRLAAVEAHLRKDPGSPAFLDRRQQLSGTIDPGLPAWLRYREVKSVVRRVALVAEKAGWTLLALLYAAVTFLPTLLVFLSMVVVSRGYRQSRRARIGFIQVSWVVLVGLIVGGVLIAVGMLE